jgi:predicted DNA-binding transcriptional regulator YafY
MKLLGEFSAAVQAAAAQSAQVEVDNRRWMRVTVPIESIEHAAGQLLSLGADVEVLAPAQLRDRTGELAMAISELYD